MKNVGVKLVTLEASTNKESTATAQDGANQWHIEVDTGGDMGNLQTSVIKHIGEQQVVDMTAVTGQINDLVIFGEFTHRFDVVNFNPVIDPVPEPGQQDVHKANDRV